MGASTFHIAMFPWFAFGHLKVYLHLSNKLAQKGHKISFLAPPKTHEKLHPFNLHPDLITFIPIAIPEVNGLSPGSETNSDIRFNLGHLLAAAFNQTEEKIENLIRDLYVDVVFFDFAHWIPKLARKLGIKSIYYNVIGPATVGYMMSPERSVLGREVHETDLMKPPSCYPDPFKLRPCEARAIAARMNMEFGDKIPFYEGQVIGLTQSDMIAFKASREIEGAYCDYIEAQFGKPVLLTGPFIPDPPTSLLEDKWVFWLNKFKASSVVYCAFGTECFLKKDLFQELVLGLELTGLPFLAILKPPTGSESAEAALPENFEERTKERGIVQSVWVQQQLVLEHPSVGCFITHCGSNSLSESLLSRCRLVFLPNVVGDQVINARMMGGRLRVGVEVQKGDEDGFFTREGVSEAVRLVMDEESAVGKEVLANHSRIREILLKNDLESSYINSFNKKLVQLMG